MHACCLDEAHIDPGCNAWCADGIHADIVYTHPEKAAMSDREKIQSLQMQHDIPCGRAIIESIHPAPEAPMAHERYKPQDLLSAMECLGKTEAFLVRYRIRDEA